MSRKFWLFVVVLLALMLALEYQMPRRFQWEPTFAHADRQPFGCYVFDSIFSQEMPHGYEVCRKSLSQLALQDTAPRSILILSASYQHRDINVDTLLALAHRGCRILLATSLPNDDLCDTLHLSYSPHGIFDIMGFRRTEHDSIFWRGDTSHYRRAVYDCNKQLITATFMHNDSVESEELAVIHDDEALAKAVANLKKEGPVSMEELMKLRVPDIVAVSFPMGRGELILVSTPLLLTNYGVLNSPGYVHRLMNRLRDLPVVRTEAYMSDYDPVEESPFREFLKRPPLRWALYLVLLGVVLFMGFNARRRQRAIPVEQPPRNYQLDFIRHIGTLKYLKL